MKFRELPTQQYLEECFTYDPEEDKLFWRQRPRYHFNDERAFNTWNSRYSGEEAFTTKDKDGYRTGRIKNKSYKFHRIVYKLLTGNEPEYIDHVAGIQAGDKIKNLQSVSHAENLKNQKKRITNSSGFTGISWDKKSKKWRVQITVNFENKYLGLYENLEEAKSVRREADLIYGFHPNHGRHLQTVTKKTVEILEN